jgi:hypothetical protein
MLEQKSEYFPIYCELNKLKNAENDLISESLKTWGAEPYEDLLKQ